MITDEKKNRIESLTDEEMSYEINLGRRSRFQRESFAYLQTCYQQRKNEKEKHDAMMRAFHKVPLAHELEVMPDIDLAELQSQLAPDSPGKIIVENEWQRRKSSKIPKLATNPAVNNLKLQNLINEIESQYVKFDSDRWPHFQQMCVEWGDKVVPFLNPEEKNKFNRELDSIRAVIHEPYLPSDTSGAPKANAFNRMKGIAKQRLQEGENIMGAIDELEKKGVAEVLRGVAEGRYGQPGSPMRLQVEDWLRLKDYERAQAKPASTGKSSVNLSLSAWSQIEKDFGVSKRMFGKKINFVKDDFKRKIIFRDVEQAYVLAHNDFNKPAVILSGSIIEELLRLYLVHKGIKPNKDDFYHYIQACQKDLKSAVQKLTDAVRDFRNFVHMEKEASSRHTISKAIAKGAVASIFTLINDFH